MSARFLLRRAWTSAARPSTRFAANATPSRIAALTSSQRFFGAPANQAAPLQDTHRYEKLVEESIKKLMTTTAHDNEMKPISDEDLEVRLNYFQVCFAKSLVCFGFPCCFCYIFTISSCLAEFMIIIDYFYSLFWCSFCSTESFRGSRALFVGFARHPL